jgi:RNA polymerase sporulation-specific sigma factor
VQNVKSPGQLCADNLRLATWAANKFTGCGLDFDDLQAAGNLGLVKAAHKFDPARGCTFATFAAACIRNEILMLLRREKPHMCLRRLEENLLCDGEDLCLGETIADPASLEDQCEQCDVTARALCCVDALPVSQRDVIRLSFGLDGEPPLSQTAIAKRLGMSPAWVSRTKKAALENLKEGFA